MASNSKINGPGIKQMIKRLSELEEGASGIIHGFESDELFLKLMEMGCIPGEKVVVEKIAPLGDPVSVIIAGYKLSLRISEAELIFVDTN